MIEIIQMQERAGNRDKGLKTLKYKRAHKGPFSLPACQPFLDSWSPAAKLVMPRRSTCLSAFCALPSGAMLKSNSGFALGRLDTVRTL